MGAAQLDGWVLPLSRVEGNIGAEANGQRLVSETEDISSEEIPHQEKSHSKRPTPTLLYLNSTISHPPAQYAIS
ncbi:hypothetical protein SLA2020_216950 [Shorea laevis]